MSGEKKPGMGDTLVKAVLVLFISLLSFSVGTFVGKQVSDSDHRKMALEGDYKAERSVASTDDHGGGHDAQEKISDKEVESLTEEFVNKEKAASEDDHDASAVAHAEESHADKVAAKAGDHAAAGAEHGAKGESQAEKAAAQGAKDTAGFSTYARNAKKALGEPALKAEDHGKTAANAKAQPALKADGKTDAKHGAGHEDAISQVSQKVVHDQAPTDGLAEERKPAAVLPSVASSAIGKYTVQVASYAEEKEAKGHAAGLKGKGWNAFYLPATINGRTWYRVLVGLFDNSKSAQEFRAQFMKEANTKAAIVQKIVQ